MSQWRDSSRATAPWRELAIAAAVSLGITFLLALGVWLIWTLGRSATPPPGIGNADPPTPTPRAIVIVQAPLVQDLDTDRPGNGGASESDGLLANESVAPLSTGRGSDRTEPESGPLVDAPATVSFASLAAGSWAGSDGILSNQGTSAVAERWLTVGRVEASALAVEAEIRVDRLLDAVCHQSFGLVVGDALTEQALGGGVMFPCEQEVTLARLSDVTAWQPGYHTAPMLAEQPLDPGSDWHTYRFEISRNQLQLVVDGRDILDFEPLLPLPADTGGREIGIWTQGVGVEIRRVTVTPLLSS